jgi:hypothetical protein
MTKRNKNLSHVNALSYKLDKSPRKLGVLLMKKTLRESAQPAAKKKKYPSITFRPDAEMSEQIERAVKATKMKKSTIVQECVREHLPHLLALTWQQTHKLMGGTNITDEKAPNSALGIGGYQSPAQAGEQSGDASHPSHGRNK